MFMNSREEDLPRPTYAPSAPPTSHAGTIIARGVKVEGEFSSQGDVVIEGEVQGNIAAVGTLTVGSEAIIKADLKSEEAIISGTVTGNVTVTKQLVLHSSAKIKGNIVCERITVESGAMLEGNVRIGHAAASEVKAKDMPKEVKVKIAAPEPIKAAT